MNLRFSRDSFFLEIEFEQQLQRQPIDIDLISAINWIDGCLIIWWHDIESVIEMVIADLVSFRQTHSVHK